MKSFLSSYRRCLDGMHLSWLFVACVMWSALATQAPAQPPPPDLGGNRQHILLPPTQGATVLSTYINASANMLAATGDFLESLAIARRHNAAAVEHELDNAVKYVETYFKRREINRMNRFGEKHLDRLEKQDMVQDREILHLPGEVLKGDVTEELNWLLDKLATASLSGALIPPQAGFGGPPVGALSPDHVHHIRVTDGGKRGQKVVFRLDGAHALEPDWPLLLRAPELAPWLANFETLRNAAMQEALQHGQISFQTAMQLRQSVTDLMIAFDHFYPEHERLASPADFPEFLAAEKFLKSLALQVLRVAKSNDVKSMDGSYGFRGGNVVDLVQHMTSYGLKFAPPDDGDEGSYEYLFRLLRAAYEQVREG